MLWKSSTRLQENISKIKAKAEGRLGFMSSLVILGIGILVILGIGICISLLLYKILLYLDRYWAAIEVHFKENDKFVERQILISSLISTSNKIIKKINWNFEHVWERVNDNLEITYYSDEMIKAKRGIYLKRNEIIKQIYEQLYDWGQKTIEAKKDEDKLKGLLNQLEVSQYTIYKILEEINDELIDVEIEYVKKEETYRNKTLSSDENMFKDIAELNS